MQRPEKLPATSEIVTRERQTKAGHEVVPVTSEIGARPKEQKTFAANKTPENIQLHAMSGEPPNDDKPPTPRERLQIMNWVVGGLFGAACLTLAVNWLSGGFLEPLFNVAPGIGQATLAGLLSKWIGMHGYGNSEVGFLISSLYCAFSVMNSSTAITTLLIGLSVATGPAAFIGLAAAIALYVLGRKMI
ncbi:MAG: hypothetical protein RLZZ283_209 [Candidatus Parcubacteria bacterium]|jgi:hypothetical protein